MLNQRCLHHPVREAVARCPECRRHFCRECVTEHDGRFVCAPCLKRTTRPVETRKFPFATAFRVVNLATGVVVAMLCYYALGQLLLRTPAEFHEGTLWKRNFMDDTPTK